MKKHRTVKRKMAAPKIKTVVLHPTAVLQVVAPKGVVPVVVADPAKNVVEIIPVKQSELKKSWWASLFS